MSEAHVWYAAFGSNLVRSRFLVYLTGGMNPVSPSGREQQGARDPSMPSGDQPFRIERTLLFTGSSPQWGDGATAAVDFDHNPITPTYGRAYRLTTSQFEDVMRQKCRASSCEALDLPQLRAAGHLDMSPGRYGRAAFVGTLDGEVVATITTLSRPAGLGPAHHSYLRVMAAGLHEAWGMGPEEAAAYLASRPGNAGIVDPSELASTLSG